MPDGTDINAPVDAPSPPPAPPATGVARGIEWLLGGWKLVRKDLVLWLAMAALYMLLALLLRGIPLMGSLVLVLISPLPLAGALLTARAVSELPAPVPPRAPRNLRDALERFLFGPARALGRGLDEPGKGFPLVLACILTLGVVMVVAIIEYVLTGGSVLSGLSGTRYSAASLRPMALVATGVVLALYILLVMGLTFFLHFVLFGHTEPVAALAASFRLSARNLLSFAAFVLPFLLPLALTGAAFGSYATRWLGYLLVLTLGSVTLAVFVAGSYRAFTALQRGERRAEPAA